VGVPPRAFFREPYQHELLARSVLPELARANGRRSLRLWSASCSSGQDAWSLAMIVEEAGVSPLEVTILATDRDPQALAHAGDAVYRDDEMSQVNLQRRRRYFVRGQGPRKGLWRVVAALRDRVEFDELDLLDPWPERGAFDIVFCHDLVASDARAAGRLVRRFADVLAPGGTLFLGDAAALSHDVPAVERYAAGVYRKR
jgi:chemotaxis protein methyltransferase CheR